MQRSFKIRKDVMLRSLKINGWSVSVPPSWTCDLGRWQPRSGSGRGAGHRQPSCSWRRTSAVSARAPSTHGTAGCHERSEARSRAWRSADVGTEPCSRPACVDQRSTRHHNTTTIININKRGYSTAQRFSLKRAWVTSEALVSSLEQSPQKLKQFC